MNPHTKYNLDEDTDYVGVVGHGKFAASPEEDSVLIYRFPKTSVWIPKKKSRKIDEFADSGYEWQVWLIPAWLFDKGDFLSRRNLYEQRFDDEENLRSDTVPIKTQNRPWIPNDRASWLRGRVRQLLSDYGTDWARDRGLLMSEGVKTKVMPLGPSGEASVEIRVPKVEGAGGVIDRGRRFVEGAVKEFRGDVTTWKENGHFCWKATVFAPSLVI